MKINTNKEQFLILIILIIVIAIITCRLNEDRVVEEKTINVNEIADQQQEKQRWEERKAITKLFTDGFNYYNGDKGKIQNYGKAEELFRSTAEKGEPFAPHYLIKILIQKFDKLKPTERTLDHIKECYFWLLIAISHSRQHRYEDYYCGYYIGDATDVFSYKGEFEKRLSQTEIQEIQDKATVWWEANIENCRL